MHLVVAIHTFCFCFYFLVAGIHLRCESIEMCKCGFHVFLLINLRLSQPQSNQVAHFVFAQNFLSLSLTLWHRPLSLSLFFTFARTCLHYELILWPQSFDLHNCLQHLAKRNVCNRIVLELAIYIKLWIVASYNIFNKLDSAKFNKSKLQMLR